MRHTFRFLVLFVAATICVAIQSININAKDLRAPVALNVLYVGSDSIVSGEAAPKGQFPHGGRQRITIKVESVIKGVATARVEAVEFSGERFAPGTRAIFFLAKSAGEFLAVKLRESDAADLRELHEIYSSGYKVRERVTDLLITRAASPRTRHDGAYDLKLFLEEISLDAGSSMDPNGKGNPCESGGQGSACDPNGVHGGNGSNGSNGKGGYIGSGFRTNSLGGNGDDNDGLILPDNGCVVDPHGCPGNDNPDSRGTMDPDGASTNSGPRMDDNGAAGNRCGADYTACIDPNGRPARSSKNKIARKGYGMDPNGTVANGVFGIDPNGGLPARPDDTCHLDPNGCGPVTNSGPVMDPNGGDTTDSGPRMDDNGRRNNSARRRPISDPNGACPYAANEAGGCIDPLGKPASLAGKVLGMDPNGATQNRDAGPFLDPNGFAQNADAGWQMDPDGRPTRNTDNGCKMDPSGCASARSSFIDPNGASANGDTGSCIDPFGLPCAQSSYGMTIDPNGFASSCIDPQGHNVGVGIDPNGFSATQRQTLLRAAISRPLSVASGCGDLLLLHIVAKATGDRQLARAIAELDTTLNKGVSEWDSDILKRGAKIEASNDGVSEWESEILKRGTLIRFINDRIESLLTNAR